MKKLFTLIFLTLSFTSSAYALESAIECDFSQAKNNKNINMISITTGNPGQVAITYDNGNQELLAPEEMLGGIFNQIYFPPVIEFTSDASKKTNVYVTSSQSGPVQISYLCNKPFRTSCSSFSPGNYSRIAIALFNINGSVFKFNDKELSYCKRARL